MAQRKQRFLEALEGSPDVTEACRLSKFPRSTAYNLRETDPEFAAAWDEARERGWDAVEDEAVRRAQRGTLRPIYQQGKLVGHERVYSDRLMEIGLKANRRERYGDSLPLGAGADFLAVLSSLSTAIDKRRQLEPKLIEAEPGGPEKERKP